MESGGAPPADPGGVDLKESLLGASAAAVPPKEPLDEKEEDLPI
jgi:hypothetical protein